MALQLLGYWKVELRDSYPFPQKIELELEPAVREQAIHHLDVGVSLRRFRGSSPCRYGCGSTGCTELSDGVWIWPEGLAHYVREHRIGLPPEFLRHVCQQNAPPVPGRAPQ